MNCLKMGNDEVGVQYSGMNDMLHVHIFPTYETEFVQFSAVLENSVLPLG